jgi:hypothetical protein
LKKLVRRLLDHYDRYGVVAAFAWLALYLGIAAILLIPINQAFLSFTNIGPQLSIFPTMLIASPVIIYITPVMWAAGFLIVERMWMFVGIQRLRGLEPYHYRKLIGRLAGEQKH